jgi:NAD(P)H-nitrite reductase large subunit
MHHLIIGGGVAGTTCAEELRKMDPGFDITIISEEHHPLYSRVLLPHYIKGKVSRERVFLKKESWYQEQRIGFLGGIVAQHLDTKNKFVTLSDSREMPYDKLLIATGGGVRLVGSDPHGVSYLRTLDDADHFLQLIAEGGATRAGVYGSGLIACEYINLFAHFGFPTVLAYRGEHFFSRSLVPDAGALIANHISAHGVLVHPLSELVALQGDKELTGFVTRGCEYACSILGIGIGVESDFGWLKESGVETNVGVKANEFLETNVPDVYVAGDVAEFYHPILDRQLTIGNWMNAMSQGRCVASSMNGERESFNLVSSYATNVFGLEIIFVGDTNKATAQNIRIIGSLKDGGITQVFEREGRAVGGVMIGRNEDRAGITQAIQNKTAFIG